MSYHQIRTRYLWITWSDARPQPIVWLNIGGRRKRNSRRERLRRWLGIPVVRKRLM